MANLLREAVKKVFYPFAESKGFVRAKSRHPHFTVFTRVRGTVVQVFDVQWDKYGRPAFVINFGEASLDEVPDLTGIDMAQCGMLYRLQPDRDSPRWWRLRKPWLVILTTGRLRYEPEDVIGQVVACFPEVESWWSEKSEGPHVKVVWRTRLRN